MPKNLKISKDNLKKSIPPIPTTVPETLRPNAQASSNQNNIVDASNKITNVNNSKRSVTQVHSASETKSESYMKQARQDY